MTLEQLPFEHVSPIILEEEMISQLVQYFFRQQY